MTKQEAIELAARIPKESRVQDTRAKAGSTNGLGVVHVTADRASETLKSEGEWLGHPLNKRNGPVAVRKKKPRKGDEADKATIEAALDENTIYSPED